MSSRFQLLGEVAEVFPGLFTRSDEGGDFEQAGNVLTVRNLGDAGLLADRFLSIDLTGRDAAKYKVRPGDLLVSSRSTSLKMAVVPDSLDGCLINATLLCIRCLPKLHPRLLMAWLNQPEGQAALDVISQSGTHQMNITVAGLTKMLVPVPPWNHQERIVRLLESAEDAYSASIQAANDRLQLARQIVVTQLKSEWSH